MGALERWNGYPRDDPRAAVGRPEAARGGWGGPVRRGGERWERGTAVKRGDSAPWGATSFSTRSEVLRSIGRLLDGRRASRRRQRWLLGGANDGSVLGCGAPRSRGGAAWRWHEESIASGIPFGREPGALHAKRGDLIHSNACLLSCSYAGLTMWQSILAASLSMRSGLRARGPSFGRVDARRVGQRSASSSRTVHATEGWSSRVHCRPRAGRRWRVVVAGAASGAGHRRSRVVPEAALRRKWQGPRARRRAGASGVGAGAA